MVDFKKLRASKAQADIIDPIEIFRRLPKPEGINDLYTSQAEALKQWFQRKDERDLVIKLHTGGGKTLVGLLIAHSVLAATRDPVVYASPTVQLVEQTLAKAKEYGLSAVKYNTKAELPNEFMAARAPIICTYQALFNGKSKFGIRGGSAEIVRSAAVIVDDAHVAFSAIRDQFSLRVVKSDAREDYGHLTNLFRQDFNEIGRLGTFDDIVTEREYSVLEVPYWSWKAKSAQVREYLRERANDYPFQWPFLRDAFDFCHCLIAKTELVITPLLPLVDMIPTFAECPRRIFMSATIGDDSSIVRTFDAQTNSLYSPITSSSLAGVSERMILIPELMKFPIQNVSNFLENVASWMANKKKMATVVLVPSSNAAKEWESVATIATSDTLGVLVRELQEAQSVGPIVFANRYDGIDLPGSACRLLIIHGVPRGISVYDAYRSIALAGSSELTNTIAQRVEQGMGRGARGGSDYCLVVLAGKDLVAWIGRPTNSNFLTSSTRAQLHMGSEVGLEINSSNEFAQTAMRCLTRDHDWVEYHAETLAQLVEPETINATQLEQASVERKAFRLGRDNYFEKAITTLERYCDQTHQIDLKSRGWLLQLAARAACYWGKEDISQRLQQGAYSDNENLLRPRMIPAYVPLALPSDQSASIVTMIEEFGQRRAFVAHFDEVVSHLVAEASSNQFEQALANLGSMLGFSTERPDKKYGKGPDVMWLLDTQFGLVIEAKSRKNSGNALTRSQHGQLLNAAEWFASEYPSYECVRVSMHPNVQATASTVTGNSKAFTFEKLNALIAEARGLFVALCDSAVDREALVLRCEGLLQVSTLRPNSLIDQYFVPFEEHE